MVQEIDELIEASIASHTPEPIEHTKEELEHADNLRKTKGPNAANNFLKKKLREATARANKRKYPSRTSMAMELIKIGLQHKS